MYPIRREGETVFENVLRYMTLSLSERANRVSSGFVETENSDSKSSSIIYLSAGLARSSPLNHAEGVYEIRNLLRYGIDCEAIV